MSADVNFTDLLNPNILDQFIGRLDELQKQAVAGVGIETPMKGVAKQIEEQQKQIAELTKRIKAANQQEKKAEALMRSELGSMRLDLGGSFSKYE